MGGVAGVMVVIMDRGLLLGLPLEGVVGGAGKNGEEGVVVVGVEGICVGGVGNSERRFVEVERGVGRDREGRGGGRRDAEAIMCCMPSNSTSTKRLRTKRYN